VIGIAHAGWRGTVQGIGGQMIRLMVETYGCVPHQIRAAIGPSIGPDHYQVGDEVVEAVRAHFGTLEGLVSYDAWDYSAYLNLWAANELDLRRSGVNHVEVAGICTACHTDEFYSHRAEQGKTGRFAGVISL
jgi:YfiH family protein